MRRRASEALVISGLVAVALVSGEWRHHGWWVVLGVVFASCTAAIAWIALGFQAIGRAPHVYEPADLEVVEPFPFLNLLPALFVGMFGVAFIFGSTVEKGDGARPLLAFGLIASTIAVLVATRRDGLRIQVAKRRVVHWRGCLFPWRTYPMLAEGSTIPTDGTVELGEDVIGRGKPKPHISYYVTVRPSGLRLRTTSSLDIARQLAEQTAKALAIDIVDLTVKDDTGKSGHRIRTVAELDVPLAEQLRRRGVVANRRELPAKSRLELVSEEMPWRVRISPLGLRVGDIVMIVFFTPFIGILATIPAAVLAGIASGSAHMTLFPTMLGLCAVVANWFGLWRVVLRARRETQHIELSPTKLRVVRRAPDLYRNHELSADRIEDIAIEPDGEALHEGLCVVVRGDGVSITFGHQLSREDAIWLRDTTLAALAPRSIYR